MLVNQHRCGLAVVTRIAVVVEVRRSRAQRVDQQQASNKDALNLAPKVVNHSQRDRVTWLDRKLTGEELTCSRVDLPAPLRPYTRPSLLAGRCRLMSFNREASAPARKLLESPI